MLLLLTVLLTGDWPLWDTSDAMLTLCRLTPIGMNGFVGWWFSEGGRGCCCCCG